MIWFTSDWHLWHKNIIKYCNRPFSNTHYMNDTIIENYKGLVQDEDEVYFLGDLTMLGNTHFDKLKTLIEGLPGIKHLVLGNHDRFKPFAYHEMGFSSVHTAVAPVFWCDHHPIGMPNIKFYLAHDPAWAQQENQRWVCGHVHGHWRSIKTKSNTVIVNVGVDVWNFNPVSLDSVIDEMRTYPNTPWQLA